MIKGTNASHQLIPLDYRSYDLPFVVRLMKPALYKTPEGYQCQLLAHTELCAVGSTRETTLQLWAETFRQNVGSLPYYEVNEYIKQLKEESLTADTSAA